MPLGDNYVFIKAALVPMVFPLAVKASVKLFGYHPKLAEGGSIVIGQIAPMFLDGNSHLVSSFRSVFTGTERKGGERQRGRGDWSGKTKAPEQRKAIRVQVTTL